MAWAAIRSKIEQNRICGLKFCGLWSVCYFLMAILLSINITLSFNGYFQRSYYKKKFCLEGGEMFAPLKSELDELQEEVARRAHEQELRRKREKEMEAAMGFNPRPSRFMDLDELQNQGNFLNAVYFVRLWC